MYDDITMPPYGIILCYEQEHIILNILRHSLLFQPVRNHQPPCLMQSDSDESFVAPIIRRVVQSNFFALHAGGFVCWGMGFLVVGIGNATLDADPSFPEREERNSAWSLSGRDTQLRDTQLLGAVGCSL